MNVSPPEVHHEPSDTKPLGPGPRLRQAREGAGLDLEEVAARLHLDPATVEALETNAYAVLPAPTFVRGYLRGYARLVGLASEPLVEEFDSQGLAPPALVADISEGPQARTTDLPVRIATWVILGGLVLLVVMWWRSQNAVELGGALPDEAVDATTAQAPTAPTAQRPVTAQPATPTGAVGDAATVEPASAQSPLVGEPASGDTPEAPGAPTPETAAETTPRTDRASSDTTVAVPTESVAGEAPLGGRTPTAAIGAVVAPGAVAPGAVAPGAVAPPALAPAPAASQIAPAPPVTTPAPGPAFAPPVAAIDAPALAEGALPGTLAESAVPSALAEDAAPGALAASAVPGTPAAETRAAGEEHLVMRFRTESWVEVYDRDDQRLFFNLARPDGVVDVIGRGPLRVLLGQAEGVEVLRNGRPLDISSYISGNIARFQIGAAGAEAASAD
jgi:cytoskeleton protein RodZ